MISIWIWIFYHFLGLTTVPQVSLHGINKNLFFKTIFNNYFKKKLLLITANIFYKQDFIT